MINDMPNINSSSRYSTTETANILGIHRTSLWRATKDGLILCNVHKSGRRFYYGREIIRFWKENF